MSSDDQKQNINSAFPGRNNKGTQLEVTVPENADEIFNPQAALAGVQNYIAFNNAINKMIGIESKWFRAVPQQRSKDVIINEYTLYNTDGEGKCIKVVVPDGNFPDSKYNYDLMGLEYEVPLTVHIDKTYWEELFGYGTAPQKKDIVYLPMPNKLYQVESSYLERGFMEQETHWAINLRKYQPEAARHESEALQETIDKYTTSEEELFGEEYQKEEDKITNDQQFSPMNETERDKYRVLDKNLQIVASDINIFGVLVSNSHYLLNTSSNDIAIKYNIRDYISEDSDRSIMAWVQIPDNENKIHNLTWIQRDDTLTPPANYKIKVKTNEKYENGDYLTIYLSEALRFYVKIIDNSHFSSGIYYCQIDNEIETYLNSIKKNWANLKNYKVQKESPINIINGQNQANLGLDVYLISRKYIKVDYANDTYITKLPSLLNNNKWYGIVVNISNKFNQYNAYIWEPGNTEDQKLRIKHYETQGLSPKIINIDNFEIYKSNSYLTNIRVFSSTIKEENQDKELLAYFTENADYGIVLDNSDEKLSMPYISQQR